MAGLVPTIHAVGFERAFVLSGFDQLEICSMSLFTAIADRPPAQRTDEWLRRWMFAVFALGVTFAAAAAIARTDLRTSCERTGSFSAGFSRGFDVVRTECRVKRIRHSPLITFYEAPPYVELSWPK